MDVVARPLVDRRRTAAAFYGFRVVLIPYNLSTELLIKHLIKVKPDFLIAEAATFEQKTVLSAVPSLRHVIWVVEVANRQMDWNQVPAGIDRKVEVAVWHDLVDERKSLASSDVLGVDKSLSVSPLSTFASSTDNGIGELLEYTSEVSSPTPAKDFLKIATHSSAESDLRRRGSKLSTAAWPSLGLKRPTSANDILGSPISTLLDPCGLVLPRIRGLELGRRGRREIRPRRSWGDADRRRHVHPNNLGLPHQDAGLADRSHRRREPLLPEPSPAGRQHATTQPGHEARRARLAPLPPQTPSPLRLP